MTDDKTVLNHTDVHAAGIDDWQVLLRSIHTRFRTGDFVTGLRLANAIGEAAEELNHHPDLDLRYPHLDVKLTSHDVRGITARDLRLARRISELAAAEGIVADPSDVSVVELALDTADHDAIKPFWRAILGFTDTDAPDEVVDADGRLPSLWFQATEPHEVPRQRFHLDIHVAHGQARSRVDAALRAGGTLVSDAAAPSFWVLADADGNKACVCTCEGRE